MSDEALELRAVSKAFGRHAALHDVSLRLRPDGYTCIMGPSGSGKSTLLRILGGHERPDAGRVLLGDRDVTAWPAERRPLHTVFQDHGLFPFMSVLDNVAFAGRVAGVPRDERHRRARERLEQVGLAADRYAAREPLTLSGGEAQRVALARALFDHPAFVLLDEPLSALDRHLRASLRRSLRALQRSAGLGFVHVTHDPDEAMALADALVVLVDGRVAAHGEPTALYQRPPSLVVARLLGELAPVPGGFVRPERLRVRTDQAGRAAADEHARAPLAGGVELTLRVAGQLVVAHAPALPPGPVTSVDWSDADVLSFEP
jgi:ABC-type Fe3+/spermidine/putrescine transport system ATPase subunit